VFEDCFTRVPTSKKNSVAHGLPTASGEADGVNLSTPAPAQPVQSIPGLDLKYLRNAGIIFKLSRLSVEAIKEAITQADTKTLSADTLLKIRGVLPGPDAAAKLKAYSGSGEGLPDIERFVLMLARIPRVAPRIDCLIFMEACMQDCDALEETLDKVSKACQCVQRSPRLHKMLEVVLAAGNYLNQGDSRLGSAQAIGLSSLGVLRQVKTVDSKRNMMHILVAWLQGDEDLENLLLLSEDLDHMAEALYWDLSVLAGNVKQMEMSLSKVEKQVEQADAEDGSLAKVKEFLRTASPRIHSLTRSMQDLEAAYSTLARSYGEDPSAVSSSAFFKFLADFIADLHRAEEENSALRQKEERLKKRKAQEEARKAQLQQAATVSAPTSGQSSSASVSSAGTKSRDGSVLSNILKARRMSIQPEDDDEDDEEDDEWTDSAPLSRKYSNLLHGLDTDRAIIDNASTMPLAQKQSTLANLGYQPSSRRSFTGMSNPSVSSFRQMPTAARRRAAMGGSKQVSCAFQADTLGSASRTASIGQTMRLKSTVWMA
jgi:hypothetical protein